MTLGSFFRDYVYIPLGGNRKRVFFNLFVVWFLTGFWHGASWNFVIWGLYNGFFIMMERLLRKWFDTLPAFIRHLYLIVVVDVGFVFFYHSDLGHAVEYIKVMFGYGGNLFNSYPDVKITFMNNVFFILLAVIMCMPVSQKLKELSLKFESTGRARTVVMETLKYLILFAILIVCTAFLAGNSFSPFLYYQF